MPDPYDDPDVIARFVGALNGNLLYIDGMNAAENEEINKSMNRLKQLGEVSLIRKDIIF